MNPVMTPPGCAKLPTNPPPIGSDTLTKTIGIVLFSRESAATAAVVSATITFRRKASHHRLDSDISGNRVVIGTCRIARVTLTARVTLGGDMGDTAGRPRSDFNMAIDHID